VLRGRKEMLGYGGLLLAGEPYHEEAEGGKDLDRNVLISRAEGRGAYDREGWGLY